MGATKYHTEEEKLAARKRNYTNYYENRVSTEEGRQQWAELQRRWYRNNKQRAAELHKKWVEENIEKYREYQREYQRMYRAKKKAELTNE